MTIMLWCSLGSVIHLIFTTLGTLGKMIGTSVSMNGPQWTAVSRKELSQKRKQNEFLIIL